MALPRTKLADAMAAMGLAAPARRPARRAGAVRRKVEAIVRCYRNEAIQRWGYLSVQV